MITLQSEGLAAAAAAAQKLAAGVQADRAQLEKLVSRLDDSLHNLRQHSDSMMAVIPGFESPSVSKGFRHQISSAEALSKLLAEASGKPASETSRLRSGLDKLKLSIAALGFSGPDAVFGTAADIISGGIIAGIAGITSVAGRIFDGSAWADLTDWLGSVISPLDSFLKKNPQYADYAGRLQKTGLSKDEVYKLCSGHDVDYVRQQTLIRENTSGYQNGSKNWVDGKNGRQDYSGFRVVNGFKEEYCLNQHDYAKIFGTQGCTATCDCILASIKKGRKIEPAAKDWSSGGAVWNNSKTISGSKGGWTVERQCQETYQQLISGNPVILRVQGHSVTAIGFRDGVDPARITPDDILVIDPGEGTVKTVNQIYSGYTSNTTHLQLKDYMDWPVRIPK